MKQFAKLSEIKKSEMKEVKGGALAIREQEPIILCYAVSMYGVYCQNNDKPLMA